LEGLADAGVLEGEIESEAGIEVGEAEAEAEDEWLGLLGAVLLE
jgi:hypothetical protein